MEGVVAMLALAFLAGVLGIEMILTDDAGDDFALFRHTEPFCKRFICFHMLWSGERKSPLRLREHYTLYNA